MPQGLAMETSTDRTGSDAPLGVAMHFLLIVVMGRDKDFRPIGLHTDWVQPCAVGLLAPLFIVEAPDRAGVGLHDLNRIAYRIQFRFIAEPPASSHDPGLVRWRAMEAVVMANDFQSQFARQCRHIDFTLVFVAGNDIDGISGSDIDAVSPGL